MEVYKKRALEILRKPGTPLIIFVFAITAFYSASLFQAVLVAVITYICIHKFGLFVPPNAPTPKQAPIRLKSKPVQQAAEAPQSSPVPISFVPVPDVVSSIVPEPEMVETVPVAIPEPIPIVEPVVSSSEPAIAEKHSGQSLPAPSEPSLPSVPAPVNDLPPVPDTPIPSIPPRPQSPSSSSVPSIIQPQSPSNIIKQQIESLLHKLQTEDIIPNSPPLQQPQQQQAEDMIPNSPPLQQPQQQQAEAQDALLAELAVQLVASEAEAEAKQYQISKQNNKSLSSPLPPTPPRQMGEAQLSDDSASKFSILKLRSEVRDTQRVQLDSFEHGFASISSSTPSRSQPDIERQQRLQSSPKEESSSSPSSNSLPLASSLSAAAFSALYPSPVLNLSNGSGSISSALPDSSGTGPSTFYPFFKSRTAPIPTGIAPLHSSSPSSSPKKTFSSPPSRRKSSLSSPSSSVSSAMSLEDISSFSPSSQSSSVSSLSVSSSSVSLSGSKLSNSRAELEKRLKEARDTRIRLASKMQ